MAKFMKSIARVVVLVALVLVLIPVSDVYAAMGPSDEANIEVQVQSQNSFKSVYNAWDTSFEKVAGVTYDKKTNTLTLNKFVNPDAEIFINQMGDNFKIKISGTNEIKSINAEGNKWGCSIEMSGSGTLTINKKREAYQAIRIYGKCVPTSLKVKEGVVLKVYQKDSYNPSILVEGKNKNCLSIAGMSANSFRSEGPWEQRENVTVIFPKTCVGTTFKGFDEDDSEYVAVKDGDGYSIFRKTENTVSGYPVYENAWIWRNDEDMAGKIIEDSNVEAILLDYEWREADLLEKSGDRDFDALFCDWDENYFAFCKLTPVCDTGCFLATDLEQTNNPDELPEGWEFKSAGDNYASSYYGDLATMGKAAFSKKTAKKGGATFTWKAVSGAKGYQVRYAFNSKMTGAWSQDLSSSKKSVTISNLKSKVKVYVQVRAFTTNANGEKVYGAWSSTANVKTK